MKSLFLFLFCSFTYTGFSQATTDEPLYKRFPGLPAIQLLLSDSTTKFTKADFQKNTPVLLVLFSPDCSHCQHETEELVKYKDELKNIQIVMATLQPLSDMKDFIEKYNLNDLKNVVVGKDIFYFIPSFFKISNLPYLAMYNKKGELISTFEGTMPMAKVIETFKNNK